MLTNIQYAYVIIFLWNHVKGMYMGSSAYTVLQMSKYMCIAKVFISFSCERNGDVKIAVDLIQLVFAWLTFLTCGLKTNIAYIFESQTLLLVKFLPPTYHMILNFYASYSCSCRLQSLSSFDIQLLAVFVCLLWSVLNCRLMLTNKFSIYYI